MHERGSPSGITGQVAKAGGLSEDRVEIFGTRINPPRGPSDRSCLPSWLAGSRRLGGEMNRSQKGRAVRFTAAALRQRAKSKKTQSGRASERERDPRSGSPRVDGRTDGRTDGRCGGRAGWRRCKKKMNEVARPGKKETKRARERGASAALIEIWNNDNEESLSLVVSAASWPLRDSLEQRDRTTSNMDHLYSGKSLHPRSSKSEC